MKGYLFLILIGFIFTMDWKNYITKTVKGVYSDSFFGGKKCKCPEDDGEDYYYIFSVSSEKCNCFPELDILECKDDKKCELNYVWGCKNKGT